jgi:hypothetical protein
LDVNSERLAKDSELRGDVMTMADQYIQRGVEQGMQQGVQQGETKLRAVARRLLACGDSVETVVALTGLDKVLVVQLDEEIVN